MARGYSRYQYETSPRKLEPEYIPERKKKKVQSQKNTTKKASKNVKIENTEAKKRRKIILYIFVAFGILLAISYRNSLINENFAKVKELKSDLAAVEKENQQLQVAIESNLNLNNVEQAAKTMLGMQKLTNEQKVYINLPKKDYVEPATEEVVIEEEASWFQKILNMCLGK